MASAALVNNARVSPETFLDCPTTYGWLSPLMSFSRDLPDDSKNLEKPSPVPKTSDLEASLKDIVDFEFLLHDPVAMLPADELFSDSKLVPLQLAPSLPTPSVVEPSLPDSSTTTSRWSSEIPVPEPSSAISPKAPRRSSRWRELLGLKKLQNPKLSSSPPSKNPNPNPNPRPHPQSLKQLLNRNPTPSASQFPFRINPNPQFFQWQNQIRGSLNPLLPLCLLNHRRRSPIYSRLGLESRFCRIVGQIWTIKSRPTRM
ncbi:hypothetical protein IHE45_15G046700 [Dioscorea alata]|uniref:Uncharacterized protein n=1 Tax=Dioscorea alata TaxID=55571 RepID=A0ACB7UL66_DIOAL|nr:hypothetical protein IHE45_15G046700 [Dioscorea alata]